MSKQGMIAALNTVVDNALRMLRNRDLNLVFIHVPVPHPPGIWNPQKKALTTGDSDYLDNLDLTDRVLGQFRRQLEEIGDWNSSTVLVTADHPYRTAWSYFYGGNFDSPKTHPITHGRWQPYIPFLLKLPSQQQGEKYTRTFNAILSGDLVLAALRGEINSPSAVAAWLDAHRTEPVVESYIAAGNSVLDPARARAADENGRRP